MTKYLIVLTITAIAFLLPHSSPTLVQAQTPQTNEILSAPQPIHTTSRFETKLITKVEKIEKKIVIKEDSDKELDNDTVLTEGADGQKTTVLKIFYYEGTEYSQEVISTEEVASSDKVINHGTKVVWRTLNTPDGTVSYWRKLHVWATQYDSHCPGCDETTATGLRQGKGVIAVDPSAIRLGSRVYIPGYGIAVAGDTGGAIKGDIIDLGFSDAHTSGWISRFVDVYLLR